MGFSADFAEGSPPLSGGGECRTTAFGSKAGGNPFFAHRPAWRKLIRGWISRHVYNHGAPVRLHEPVHAVFRPQVELFGMECHVRVVEPAFPLFHYNNRDLENAKNSVIRLQPPCGTKPMVGQPDGLVSQQSTPIVGIPVIDKGHSRVLIMFVNLR